MRFMLNLFAGIFLLLLVLFFGGPYFLFPRPNTDTAAVAQVQESKDIAQYLKDSEAKFADDLKPGLEKGIDWYDPSAHDKTKISIVYFHGWSSSRRDTAPTVDILARRLKANVYFTRLHAHGLKSSAGFETLKMQDLIDDAREAIAIGQKIGEHVVLVGMSTGATLAVEQAFERQAFAEPSVMVLMSPNFMPLRKEARYLTGPFGRLIARAIVGVTYSFPIENPKHGEYWTTSYPSDGLVPMMDLVNYTNSLNLSKIHVPTLLLFTRLDQVVSVSAMHKKFERLGSPDKDMVELESATRHELVGDLFGKEATVAAADSITEFVRDALTQKAKP